MRKACAVIKLSQVVFFYKSNACDNFALVVRVKEIISGVWTLLQIICLMDASFEGSKWMIATHEKVWVYAVVNV
jgi:hypothetical protein